jgi:protein SCO1/2
LDLEKSPAPDFRLIDQNGQMVALSDLRGKVVVLTFVYSRCRDVCPIIALKLSKVYADLGDVNDQVRIVAVSVAPELDTPISIAKFSRENQMQGKWLYLTGARAELQSVWQAYYLAVVTPVSRDVQVGHQSRVVLIDRAGKERVHFDPDFDPANLVHDLRILIDE